MGFLSVISMAHKWIAERTSPGDTVIDATAGGGVDTYELSRIVGARGTVYAFDIQQAALDRTENRLAELAAMPSLHLVLRSHAEMLEAVDPAHIGKVAAVMFNLGYLPGGDQSVITRPDSTLSALRSALELLRPGGIITCVLYPGHAGGEREAAEVEAWAARLPVQTGQAVLYRQLQRPAAPYLIGIVKK
ncbi:class I SAM-dependent methyltransferase [Paenibacillus thailandensis]|uniref:Class I SAM-dependent methyltransferase n=1 Tax=Paenibacillus thailandensis TaxID=393250 RepID=A0ABW5QXE8_9BACL